MNKAQKDKTPAPNDVYEPVQVRHFPRWLYFYYLKPDRDHDHEEAGARDEIHDHHKIRVYFQDLGEPTELTQEMVETLIHKADHNLISVRGDHIADLAWRRHSYLVFVLRDREHRLDEGNAVVFSMREPEIGGNHTFRNGVDIKRPIDRDISGMWCMNLRQNRHGGPLGDGETERFNVRFPGLPARAHNEVGSNTGP